ncbi:thermonuclease family protein [Nocardioides lijunqiniae]|uniref:thermonuclease family protein n=1 Tax=Nocardioides lijunqiniae TaxID=2760832 RepID=UPI0018789DBD|nr:thermonuclease family protein [Nocardioides lijunqiniae]
MIRRTTAYLASLIIALAGALALVSAPTAQAADKDCGDFPNQAAAQNFYINNGGPDSDPHGLDSEGDGVACESLPCPCSDDQGGGGGGNGNNNPPKDPILKQKARVLRVIDGDTVKVKLIGGPKRDVRILGIDTPEVHGGVECGGRVASRAAKKMLPRGTRVLLTSDRSQRLKDRYGRLLRYIEKGKTDIGRKQLRRGNATVYVVGKPFKRVKTYRATQASAKVNNVGIWKNCR